MSWWESVWISAGFAAAFLGLLYFSFLFPGSRGKGRNPGPADSPLCRCGVEKNLREAIEAVLNAYQSADRTLLPRMDKTFRKQAEQQIDLLKRAGLRRRFEFSRVTSDPGGFRKWNDGGREWREGEVSGQMAESYAARNGDVLSRTKYDVRLTVCQSRHIRASDREKAKTAYYEGKKAYLCPSCGAELDLSSSQVNCPYCGAYIVSNFYDWQTEWLVMREKKRSFLRGLNLGMMALAVAAAVFVPALFYTRLFGWRQIELALLLSCLTPIAVLAVWAFVPDLMEHRREEQIVRYSEQYLCSCISESLWSAEKDRDVMDYFITGLRLKKIVNTESTTTVFADVRLTKTSLADNRTRQTQKRYSMQLSRARYPERLRQTGSRVEEKECPSCGANFVPDRDGCCSYCGYSLKVDNAKWKLEKIS